MSEIHLRLLLNDSSPLYPDDVAGCLLFEGDGLEARTDYGPVDLWLVELVSGLEALSHKPESWVDLTGERVSLLLFRNEQGEGLEYRNVPWRLPSGELRRALLDAADELLHAFSGFRPFAEEGNLAQLEQWCAEQQDGE